MSHMPRSIASALPPSLSKLVPSLSAFQPKPRNLYETLSCLPRDGVGHKVFQTRWQSKGIRNCYWEVTRVQLKDEGRHGKAWGKLVWRGRPVSEQEERIRGSLKYMWAEGASRGDKLKELPS